MTPKNPKRTKRGCRGRTKEAPSVAERIPGDAFGSPGSAERARGSVFTAGSLADGGGKLYEEVTRDLRERVKELNCLYGISSIVETHNPDLGKILHHIVEIVPCAWQYPEITCCRVSLGGMVVQSPDFVETPWRQSQDILANGSRAGSLEVFYREARPEEDEGPFLEEERNLIRAVAERIGKILERHTTEEALRESELKNRALLNAIPDLMFQVDIRGTLVGFHEGTFVTLRDLGRSMIGKNIYCLAEGENPVPRRLLDQGMLMVRRAIETGNPQVYEQHVALGGVSRDFEVRMVVYRDNEVLGIVRDITKRKQLEREILEISNREQRRIGQDLHDSLSQHLTGIGFMAKVLERRAASGAPLDPSDVREIVDLIDQSITMTRSFARWLNPIELQADGLMHALGKLAENVKKIFGVSSTFVCDEPIYITDSEVAINLYRIVQEALNNAVKHGKADYIVVSLARKGPQCELRVKDNGVGIGRAKEHGRGMGLSIMQYRASMIEAFLDIKSGAGGGTELVCCFPLKDGV